MATKEADKGGAQASVNEVRLVGRVSREAERKALPSGDEILSIRLVVDRPAAARRGKQRVDVVDCVIWGGRPMRSVPTWSSGDVVEVAGQIRRRFFQAGAGTGSRVEVEVHKARVIRRAASA